MDNIISNNEMEFITYKSRYDDIVNMGESRERMIQEFVIRPFLQSLTEYDVIPTDIKTNSTKHCYEKYSGKSATSGDKVVTPDLVIAEKWVWNNKDKSEDDYKITVEIKGLFQSSLSRYEKNEKNPLAIDDLKEYSPSNKDEKILNKALTNEMNAHLRKMKHVILTDGIGWHFFDKIDISSDEFKVEHIHLGRRIVGLNRNIEGIEWYKSPQKGKMPMGNRNFYDFSVSYCDNFDNLKEKIKQRINLKTIKLKAKEENNCQPT